jgi:hypothetical protein
VCVDNHGRWIIPAASALRLSCNCQINNQLPPNQQRESPRAFSCLPAGLTAGTQILTTDSRRPGNRLSGLNINQRKHRPLPASRFHCIHWPIRCDRSSFPQISPQNAGRNTFTRALSQDLQHSWKERRARDMPGETWLAATIPSDGTQGGVRCRVGGKSRASEIFYLNLQHSAALFQKSGRPCLENLGPSKIWRRPA